jgi:hypothetical protein
MSRDLAEYGPTMRHGKLPWEKLSCRGKKSQDLALGG